MIMAKSLDLRDMEVERNPTPVKEYEIKELKLFEDPNPWIVRIEKYDQWFQTKVDQTIEKIP